MSVTYASICGHPVEYDYNRMPPPYCRNCSNTGRIFGERMSADQDYHRTVRRDEYGDRYAPRNVRRRLENATVAYREELERRQALEDEERRLQGRRPRHEEMSIRRGTGREFAMAMGLDTSRSVRFADSPSHRRESQYRRPSLYNRLSSSYEPGRWSDSVGQGESFYNTSNPYRASTRARDATPDGYDPYASQSEYNQYASQSGYDPYASQSGLYPDPSQAQYFPQAPYYGYSPNANYHGFG